MIKKVITEYCDACGCKINDYSSERDILLYEQDFPFVKVLDSFILCKDCTISFREWKETRDPEGKVKELMNDEKDYIL